MKVLLIGGAGFLGRRLSAVLIECGHDVVIYDLVLSEIYPDRSLKGDIRDRVSLLESLDGVDLVVNLAAEHADNVEPRSLYFDVNVVGARNLVECCTLKGVRKIVFTSTVAVYGLDTIYPNEESAISPFNDYGRSKAEAECVYREWAAAEANSLDIVRPCVIFGEGNQGNVYNLIRQIVANRFLMVGTGKNVKSMAYVDNIVSFLSRLIELDTSYRIFNYADKPDLTSLEIVNSIRYELGRPPVRLFIPRLLGIFFGTAVDSISRITGLSFPISAVRIRKFTSSTGIDSSRSHNFYDLSKAQVNLRKGLEIMTREATKKGAI